MNDASMASFKTGATRTSDVGKPDYEGFLSPAVLDRYAQYMNKHRSTPDGGFRASDNWQLGIPLDNYMKSGWRHFMDWWRQHRGNAGQDTLEESLCALIFNAMGYLHETLKANKKPPVAGAVVVPVKGKDYLTLHCQYCGASFVTDPMHDCPERGV